MVTKIKDNIVNKELKDFSFEKIDSFEIKDLINESSKEIIELANKIAENTKNSLSNPSEQQIKFYNDCSQLIFGELKDNNPILIPAKCGFGKTTFLKSMISTIITEVKNENLSEDYLPIIITQERLEDLEKLIKAINDETDTNYIYLFKGWNEKFDGCINTSPPKNEKEHLIKCNKLNCEEYESCPLSHQLEKSRNFPIIAITTARLAILNNSIDPYISLDNYIQFTDENGITKRRNRIIIDEKPKLSEIKIVTQDTINNLRSYIEKYNRFNHSREFDKEEEISLKEQLNAISAYLLEIERDTLNEKYKIMEPDKSKYTKKLKNELIKLIGYKHPDFQKLDMFFSNLVLRCRDNNNFYIIKQNNFDTRGLKTFIFDGTAEISIEYKTGKNDFKYLKIDDYKSYPHLNFHIIKTNVSRQSLNKKKDLITEWITDTFSEKTFAVTYKMYEKYFREKFKNKTNIILDTNKFPYFGNTKGKNDWYECGKMIQIGWNRHSSDDYLAEFLSLNPEYASLWLKLYEFEMEITEFFIEQMTPDNYGNFSHNEEIYHFVFQNMVVDLEQEVYRTKIREFNTEEEVDVYLFVREKEYEIIKSMIAARFKNCNFIETDVDFKIKPKGQNILVRKGNEKLADLFNYLDYKWNGKKTLASIIYSKFISVDQWREHFGGKNQKDLILFQDRGIKLSKTKGKWYLKRK